MKRKSNKPRAKTVEEMRADFLGHLHDLVDYWAVQPNKSDKDKLDGLMFSTLVLLDGGSGLMPAYDLIPTPHPSDEAFHQSRGENWNVPKVINNCQLHELWYETKAKK